MRWFSWSLSARKRNLRSRSASEVNGNALVRRDCAAVTDWLSSTRRRRENLAWHLARNIMFDAAVGRSHGKGAPFLSPVLLATALLPRCNVAFQVFVCFSNFSSRVGYLVSFLIHAILRRRRSKAHPPHKKKLSACSPSAVFGLFLLEFSLCGSCLSTSYILGRDCSRPVFRVLFANLLLRDRKSVV